MLLAVGLAQWLPWVVLAIAIAAFGALIARFVAMYRRMKMDKLQRAALSIAEPATLTIVDGYFVMKALSPYGVGADKQLAAGNYMLKTQDGGEISLQINGVVVDYADGETLCLKEGDIVRAERDVGLLPEEVL